MPAHSHAPRFPPVETLSDFFRMNRHDRLRVAQLALLLDAPAERVRHILRSEGIELRGDSTEWGEAAGYLFDAWPRAQILETLGPDRARVVPAAFHPAAVRWTIPPFIIRAIEHQAALMRAHDPRVNPDAPHARFASSSVDDYVADILFNEIQSATVTALADDGAFLQAYRYPPLD
jgi:hypothetical protein